MEARWAWKWDSLLIVFAYSFVPKAMTDNNTLHFVSTCSPSLVHSNRPCHIHIHIHFHFISSLSFFPLLYAFYTTKLLISRLHTLLSFKFSFDLENWIKLSYSSYFWQSTFWRLLALLPIVLSTDKNILINYDMCSFKVIYIFIVVIDLGI